MNARRAGLVVAWTIVGGAGGVLASQAAGTPNAVVAALQALTPMVLGTVTVVAVAATVVDRPRLGFCAAVIGLGHLVVAAPVGFPDRGPAPATDATPLRVVAANVLFSNPRIDETAEALRRVDADVIAMAEVTPEHAARLSAHPLSDGFTHRLERPRPLARGLVVWSRYPLTTDDSGELERSIEVVVDAPDGPIRLVFVHPPPPVYHHSLWESELAGLPASVASSTHPSVVLGDLNATIFHPPLRRVIDRARLVDAVAAGGGELARTWPTDTPLPPFARIDHILTTRDLAVIDAGTVRLPGSDHHAVVATIAPARENSR